jgi:outer membrane receptor protein involved in Fe transport
MHRDIPHKKNNLAFIMYQRRKQLLATALALPMSAMASPMLEEILVTAQKRDANLQDTAVSVQVMGGEQMKNLNVQGFDDFIQFLPTVSYMGTRPGVAQIYMRGISSGGNGNHSASAPSVGVYLDEQPITTINEILDLHAYDIARVETLAGPQGTLYGSSSQSGALRIITNKPLMGEFEAGYDISANKIEHGDNGYTLEGFANIPLTDNAALRIVGWHDDQGGYIDNVAASITYDGSGITRDNSDVVEKDFNDTETSGFRALLKVDLDEDWTITPGLTYQEMRANGVFDHDPKDNAFGDSNDGQLASQSAGDLKTREFFDTFYDEEWYQASLTIEGKIGDLDFVYAGAYLDRDRTSQYDYTGYSEYLESGGSGCLYYTEYVNYDTCADPSQYVDGDENFNRSSHEFRIQSSAEERLSFIAGVFWQEQEHDFDLQWTVPEQATAASVIPGGHVTWQTKQVRNDQDQAIFGEVSFDISDQFSVLYGRRHYEYDNVLYGFNGWLGNCTGDYVDGKFVPGVGANVPQFPCFDTNVLDGKNSNRDKIQKLNFTYVINDDLMIYMGYSEGYRAGGVNRARIEGIPGYDEDFAENYEFGWKTSWLDNRLRFNGALYHVDWKDFQFDILDFDISNLTIIRNAGQGVVDGIEFDLDFAATEGLMLSLAASFNDAELDEDIITDGAVLAAKGTSLPVVPHRQMTSIARYETEIGEYGVFVQGAYSYTGASWSEMDVSVRNRQSSYELVDLSAGLSMNNMSFSIYLDNAFDERAEISNRYAGYDSSIDNGVISVNRPRTIGISFGQRF